MGAALAVYLLFRQKAAHAPALWGVAFFAAFPVSAVLQVPYAEPLNLLLLAVALLLVIRRRYFLAMPVVVLLCLSRPGVSRSLPWWDCSWCTGSWNTSGSQRDGTAPRLRTLPG